MIFGHRKLLLSSYKQYVHFIEKVGSSEVILHLSKYVQVCQQIHTRNSQWNLYISYVGLKHISSKMFT